MFAASSALAAGTAKVALIVAVETPSLFLKLNPDAPYFDKADQINAALFGDGAGAILLAARNPANDGMTLGSIRLRSVGSGKRPGIWITGSGSEHPLTADLRGDGNLFRVRQDFQGVIESGVQLYDRAFREILAAEGAARDRVALVIPHQANGQMAELLAGVFGDLSDRLFIHVKRVGNCGAASILMALDEALESRSPLRRGDLIAIVSAEASKWLYGGAAIRC
jgi:3-oxoacyl-[acyl-carrier-protein] synthase-3